MTAHPSRDPRDGADAAAHTLLTQAIINGAEVLHRLGAGERWASKGAMAQALGKDAGNLTRLMKALGEDGVVQGWDSFADLALTDLGRRVLRGLEVIDGQVVLPEGVALVPARLIVPNPDNPRTDWDSEAAVKDDAALKESIREHGVRLPLEVYPADGAGRHRLLTGERRWRAVAALIADGALPPDHELLVIVRDLGEEDAADAMAEENIQRRQLIYADEARYYEKMVTRFGRSEAQLAEKCNRSVKHIQNYRRLLKTPEVLRQLESGEINMREARDLIAEKRPEPALGGLMELPKAAPRPAAQPVQDLSPEQAAYNALTTSPRMALIVCELADKAERAPESRLAADPLCDFTEIGFAPTDSLAELLIKHGVLLVMRKAGKVYARVILKSDGSRRWLEDNGFYEGDQARRGLLTQLRHEVDSFNGAKAEQNGLYLTAWLNLPEPAIDAHPPAMTVTPDQTPVEAVVLPGLVGDAFSQQLRQAREDAAAEDAEGAADGRARPPPAEIAPEAAAARAEPGSPPVLPAKAAPRPAAALAVQDGKVIAEAARDIGEQLAQWRAEHGRGHWSTLAAEDLAEELVYAFGLGRPLMAMTVLAVARQHLGAAEVAALLRDAVARCAASGLEG